MIFDYEGYYILNDLGEPVKAKSVIEWGKWFETFEHRRLAKTEIGSVEVSTVFLARDHNFLSNGPPVLWETLVFGGPLDGEMYRYSTRLEAQRGHEEMCHRVREAAAHALSGSS